MGDFSHPFGKRIEVKMNCNTHRLETVTTTATNVVLTVSDDTNIGNLEDFNFRNNSIRISDLVTGDPLPVQINVNGVAVALQNRFGLPILSNRVPTCAKGHYVVPETGTPWVRFYTTPCNKANA